MEYTKGTQVAYRTERVEGPEHGGRSLALILGAESHESLSQSSLGH